MAGYQRRKWVLQNNIQVEYIPWLGCSQLYYRWHAEYATLGLLWDFMPALQVQL